ncbi:MAG TPA: hypothetical protein VFJ22_03125 [Dermatophilaceae bacterium]|nr:hypothetical protein [Dermatophilaceae bacterium]
MAPTSQPPGIPLRRYAGWLRSGTALGSRALACAQGDWWLRIPASSRVWPGP